MMLIFLTLADIAILGLIVAMSLGFHPALRWVIAGMAYLIGKKLMFGNSLMNWLDVFIAFYLLYLYFGGESVITIGIIVYLAYKFIASIL